MVNGWKEWGSYKEDEAKEGAGLEEVVPLVPGVEAGENDGDDEDHQHGDQEVLLSWRVGQAGGEVSTTLCKPFDGAIEDLEEDKVLDHVKVVEERGYGRVDGLYGLDTHKSYFVCVLQLIQLPVQLVSPAIQNIRWTFESEMGKTMVTNGLPHGNGHSVSGVAFSLKMAEEPLEHLVDRVRVGVLSFDLGQEALQELLVSVEEDHLNPELFAHILPRPMLALKVREGGVEEKGRDGL